MEPASGLPAPDPRACVRCHKLHVRCQGGFPCQRCKKQSHECMPLEYKKRKELAPPELLAKRLQRKANVSKVLICPCGFLFEHEVVCSICGLSVKSANTVSYLIDQLRKQKHAGVAPASASPPSSNLWCVVRSYPSVPEYWQSMRVIASSSDFNQFLGVPDAIGHTFSEFLSSDVLDYPIPPAAKKDLLLPFLAKGQSVCYCRTVFTLNFDQQASSAVEVVQIHSTDVPLPSTSAAVIGTLYDPEGNILDFVPPGEQPDIAPNPELTIPFDFASFLGAGDTSLSSPSRTPNALDDAPVWEDPETDVYLTFT